MLQTTREPSSRGSAPGGARRGTAHPPYRPRPDTFDEMVGTDGQVRTHYHRIHSLWDGLSPEQKQERRRAVDLAFLRQGITFNVYGDEAGHRAHLPLRSDAASRSGRRVEGNRGGAGAAHHGAQPVPPRHLPRAEDPEGRRHPALLRALGRALPPRVHGLRGARATSTSTSAAPTSSAVRTATTWCSRTTAAARRA